MLLIAVEFLNKMNEWMNETEQHVANQKRIIKLKTDSERKVYFGPLRNTWLRLIRTHAVGGGIPTRRSSVELTFYFICILFGRFVVQP